MTSKAAFSASIPSNNVRESVEPGVENSALERRTQTTVQNLPIFGVKNFCIPDNATVPVLPSDKVAHCENPKPEFCLPKF
jgi:hypothetical protein